MQQCEESVQQDCVADGCGGIVLPDAGSLQHIALLDGLGGFGRSLTISLSLGTSSLSERCIKVVCVGLY